MITIAIADTNQTYCQGLKTMLEQVEGFEIVLAPVSGIPTMDINKLHIDLLLVDEDLYDACRAKTGSRGVGWPGTKTIILTMDCNETAALSDVEETICKGAGKREFTERIMKLSLNDAK